MTVLPISQDCPQIKMVCDLTLLSSWLLELCSNSWCSVMPWGDGQVTVLISLGLAYVWLYGLTKCEFTISSEWWSYQSMVSIQGFTLDMYSCLPSEHVSYVVSGSHLPGLSLLSFLQSLAHLSTDTSPVKLSLSHRLIFSALWMHPLSLTPALLSPIHFP